MLERYLKIVIYVFLVTAFLFAALFVGAILLAGFLIFLPFALLFYNKDISRVLRKWRESKKSKNNSKDDKGVVIDVDYEIVDEKNKNGE